MAAVTSEPYIKDPESYMKGQRSIIELISTKELSIALENT